MSGGVAKMAILCRSGHFMQFLPNIFQTDPHTHWWWVGICDLFYINFWTLHAIPNKNHF